MAAVSWNRLPWCQLLQSFQQPDNSVVDQNEQMVHASHDWQQRPMFSKQRHVSAVHQTFEVAGQLQSHETSCADEFPHRFLGLRDFLQSVIEAASWRKFWEIQRWQLHTNAGNVGHLRSQDKHDANSFPDHHLLPQSSQHHLWWVQKKFSNAQQRRGSEWDTKVRLRCLSSHQRELHHKHLAWVVIEEKWTWFVVNPSAATKFGTFLQNLGKCYDKTLNPQVSVSFASCFRGMHIFMRDSLATYSESFFTGPNPLQGKSRTEIDLRDCVMNTTFYRDNKCGLTHGCLDTTWNIGPVGPNVSFFPVLPVSRIFGVQQAQ